ncbi:hypothetical protein IQ07DRAFT_254957 [Pyrenochaeta sp. DS3sAY3a]|nr:hypothetical protein IQ07DRAFT_254957 [Pyrenochaeta sp. DS3sAY3a]
MKSVDHPPPMLLAQTGRSPLLIGTDGTWLVQSAFLFRALFRSGRPLMQVREYRKHAHPRPRYALLRGCRDPLGCVLCFPSFLCLSSHLIALIRCFGPQRPTGEPVGWHIVRLVRINPSACACAPRTAAKLRSKLGMQRDTVVICRISWRNYFSIWGFALAP